MRESRRFGNPSTLPLLLAVVALACAALAALGPAKHVQTRYSWPPPQGDLPAEQPDRLWYTPLLLARHEPASLTATLPCRPAPALPRAARPVTILATARDPATAGGLAITRAGNALRVAVGERLVTQVDLPAGQVSGDCAYRLDVAGGQWSLSGGPSELSRNGGLEAMPIVNGVFSGLDLRAGGAPSVDVTTTVHRTETRIHQSVLWAVAALAAIAALLLVSGVRRRPRWDSAAGAARRALARAGPADAVVAVVLLGWWLIGPVFFDDGWVVARQQNYAESGGFSAYYTAFGVNLPLDYWLEWLEHWLVQSTSALLVLRVPALLCLAVTWVLCRWIFGRALASSAGGGRTALWALVSAFLVGALAWGMTLRPEPVVAVLVTGVLACMVRFLERETIAPLALAGVLFAVALSAHPAGIVAAAPLLAFAPTLGRWARPRLAAAATVVVAAVTLLGILAVVGSDLEQRRADAISLRTHGDETAGWRDELDRYGALELAPYGPPLRREWVALTILAVLAYLLRRRRDRSSPLSDLPAAGLGIALVLLIATPTKWPWHFGALIGITAVAVAAETARIREEARRSPGWQARPFFVVAAAMLAGAWSWFPRNGWGDFDLRTLDWTFGIEERVTFAKAAGALPLAVLVGLALLALGRRRGRHLAEIPWRAAAWTAPILAAPLIAFTAGVLVADAAKTKSWTVTRANVETLTGDLGCGLADDALIAVPSSMRALTPVEPGRIRSDPRLPSPPVDGLARITLGPARTGSAPARSPWFALAGGEGTGFGFFVGGSAGSSETLELEWGRSAGGRVELLGAESVSADFESDARPALVPWRFFAAGGLPSPPPGSDAVRLALRSDDVAGRALPVTAPVTYANESLARAIGAERSPTLVVPNLATYVPCVRQPRVSGGRAEPPERIIAFRDSIWPLDAGTSPFEGIFDVYQVRRLPLSDSPAVPDNLAVYAVDPEIPGAASVPPVATPLVS